MATAIDAAALTNRISTVPGKVAQAAIAAGLPSSSVTDFVTDLMGGNVSSLLKVKGVTPDIINAGSGALTQGFADSIRVVYIIAAPFGVLALVTCWFLGDLRKVMTFRVDAPVEELHAKAEHFGDSKVV